MQVSFSDGHVVSAAPYGIAAATNLTDIGGLRVLQPRFLS